MNNHKQLIWIHLADSTSLLTQYEHYGIYNIREHGQLFGYELNVKARTARYF